MPLDVIFKHSFITYSQSFFFLHYFLHLFFSSFSFSIIYIPHSSSLHLRFLSCVGFLSRENQLQRRIQFYKKYVNLPRYRLGCDVLALYRQENKMKDKCIREQVGEKIKDRQTRIVLYPPVQPELKHIRASTMYSLFSLPVTYNKRGLAAKEFPFLLERSIEFSVCLIQ